VVVCRGAPVGARHLPAATRPVRGADGMVETEPRDVDGYAHIGNLFWDMSDPHGRRLTFQAPPTTRQRTAWLNTALDHYLAGVAVAELALPDAFTGVLRWSRLDNRPLLRALHGLAICLWRRLSARRAAAPGVPTVPTVRERLVRDLRCGALLAGRGSRRTWGW
jgi:hypothetical protein